MAKRRVAIPLTTLAITALCGCSNQANQPPPGLAAQQSSAAHGGLASLATGTCKIIPKITLQTVLGGSIGTATPDTLTPGSDRCTWTITHGNLGKRVQLIAYRLDQEPITSKKHRGRTVRVPSLGKDSTWTAALDTLTFRYQNGILGIQVVTPPRTRSDAAQIKLELFRLCRDLKARGA